MKLTVSRNKLTQSAKSFLQSSGYAHIYDRKTRKDSYAIRLGRDHYPRLHMYVLEDPDNIIFNLHLDQKKPSYQGQTAHSAEYDAPQVKQEINRLKDIIIDSLNQVRSNTPAKEEKKTGLFTKILNLFK